MEQSQAEVIYQLFIGTLIPLIASGLKESHWPAHYKFGMVFLISLIAAAIVPVAQYDLTNGFDYGKFATMLGVIFTTSQVIYQSAFKYFDAESKINPKAALLSLISYEVALYLETVSKEKAKDILNPKTDSTLEVVINDASQSGEDL